MDPGSKALNPMKNFDTLPDLGSVSTIQIITCRPHILLYIMIDWCLEKINVSQWEVGKLLNKIDVRRIWACFIKLPWKVLPGCLMCWITLCTWSWLTLVTGSHFALACVTSGDFGISSSIKLIRSGILEQLNFLKSCLQLINLSRDPLLLISIERLNENFSKVAESCLLRHNISGKNQKEYKEWNWQFQQKHKEIVLKRCIGI